jgi:hypothetical protein
MNPLRYQLALNALLSDAAKGDVKAKPGPIVLREHGSGAGRPVGVEGKVGLPSRSPYQGRKPASRDRGEFKSTLYGAAEDVGQGAIHPPDIKGGMLRRHGIFPRPPEQLCPACPNSPQSLAAQPLKHLRTLRGGRRLDRPGVSGVCLDPAQCCLELLGIHWLA